MSIDSEYEVFIGRLKALLTEHNVDIEAEMVRDPYSDERPVVGFSIKGRHYQTDSRYFP